MKTIKALGGWLAAQDTDTHFILFLLCGFLICVVVCTIEECCKNKDQPKE